MSYEKTNKAYNFYDPDRHGGRLLAKPVDPAKQHRQHGADAGRDREAASDQKDHSRRVDEPHGERAARFIHVPLYAARLQGREPG